MRSKFSFTVNHLFPGTRLRVPAIFFILGGDIYEIFASPRRDKRLRYLPWTRKTSRERASRSLSDREKPLSDCWWTLGAHQLTGWD